MSKGEAVYIISVAAELAGIHPQTLRIYERRGLLNPYRTPGGTRRYSDRDLERLRAIQALTRPASISKASSAFSKLEGAVEALQDQFDAIKDQLADARAEAAGVALEPAGHLATHHPGVAGRIAPMRPLAVALVVAVLAAACTDSQGAPLRPLRNRTGNHPSPGTVRPA